ncbi:hypothetical protein MMC11_004655 [Xylographa trunciseda]|nr:hypothetical protein [Xylographa trunciseda]
MDPLYPPKPQPFPPTPSHSLPLPPTFTPAIRVPISGAAIAGTTLAWFLAKTGARITIVERAPSLLPHGPWVESRYARQRRHRYSIYRPIGTAICALSSQEVSEILRADLTKLFYEATKDLPNVNYLFGATIKEVVSNDDDTVKVELSNGAVQEFDLLVAADG